MASISTLSEINAVLTGIYHTVLQSVDERWSKDYQTVYSPLDDWDSIKESYYLRSKATELTLPFAALVRSPVIGEIDQGGGYRQWDGDWIDNPTDKTIRTVKDVVVRSVNLQYELNIYNDKMETSEALIQGFILNGTPHNQRVDYTSDVLGITSRVSFINERPYYKRIPNRTDKTRGSGYLYQIGVPIKVSGILGTYSDVSRILEVQGNIYARMQPPSTTLTEGDHVIVTWDTSTQKFKYEWSGI